MINKVLVVKDKKGFVPIGILNLQESEKLIVSLKLFEDDFDGKLLIKITENILVFDCENKKEFETVYHNLSSGVYAILVKNDFVVGVAKTDGAEGCEEILLEEYKKMLSASKTQTLSEEKFEDVENDSNQDLKEKIENTTNFLEMIKPQLDVLFEQNEHFKELEEKLPETEWVKVVCDGEEGGHYVLGKLYDGEVLTHIAYGTFAENSSQKPPEGLEMFCQFLPLDAEKPNSSGYYVMYQDAITGENVVL